MHQKLRRIIGLMIIFTVGLSVWTPAKTHADTASDFISSLKPAVVKVAKQYNLYPSLMLAQAALESSYGQSTLASQGNNYFGIKGSYNGQSVTMQTAEYNNQGQLYYTSASFKKYPSAESSFADYAQMIRNGLVGAASFYSGSWKENAKSVTDAAEALVGKYATDPSYVTKLISIINQFALTSLDSGVTEKSNAVADSSSSSKTSSASSSSAIQTGATNTDTTTTAQTTMPNVTYSVGDGNERVALSKRYAKQKLYLHIDGTTGSNKTYQWRASVKRGSNVYADSVGYVNNGGSKQTWYRIRYSKGQSAKRYWVKSQALSFPAVKYFKLAMHVNADLVVAKPYNHVYGTSTLAVKLTDSDVASRRQYLSNMVAISGSGSNRTVWMRYKLTSGQNAWVQMNSSAIATRIEAKTTKRLGSDYGKYLLYQDLPTNLKTAPTTPWNQVQSATIDKVKVDAFAIDATSKTVWAHIKIANESYWINNAALHS